VVVDSNSTGGTNVLCGCRSAVRASAI